MTDGIGRRRKYKKAAKKIGRSAITGKFMPVREAQRKSRTSVVETIKKPKVKKVTSKKVAKRKAAKRKVAKKKKK